MGNEYFKIAADRYPFSNQALSDELLRRYFEECFDDMFEAWPEYPAWVCVQCATRKQPAVDFDFKHSSRCTVCGSEDIYQIATFQSRATRSGRVFQAAVQLLCEREFGIVLRSVAGSTHRLEFGSSTAIQAKGSPWKINIPNIGEMELDRPGLIRNDTVDKVVSNARNYKQTHRRGKFFVLTNALPAELTVGSDEHIDGFFDATKVDHLEDFASLVQQGP